MKNLCLRRSGGWYWQRRRRRWNAAP